MFGFGASSVPVLSPESLASRLEAGEKPCIVDVREPHETAAGHIPGARLVPLGTLEAHLGELPAQEEVVMVCRSGGRSAMATQMALSAGLKAVNMSGGMLAWRGAVVRP
ncbi:MAG: rhodanese-like domain-containing protein [Candidatus Sericytochromatia bacterium]|nr:rhodanese-like domain-containing protein [Candidatus Sericytochromatia bacterium]